jgi:hypothetical protein
MQVDLLLWNEHVYSHVLHNDVSFNEGLHIQRWSHKIIYNIILTIVLQLPRVFSIVTCCTGI